jgi:hypothetical protein
MPRILPWKRREREAPEIPNSARSRPAQRVKREDAARVGDERHLALSLDVGTTTKKTVKRPRRLLRLVKCVCNRSNLQVRSIYIVVSATGAAAREVRAIP